MPRYTVTKPRFYDGVFCEPGGKHGTITASKAIDPLPDDLILIDEQAAMRAVEAKSKKPVKRASKNTENQANADVI